MTAALDGVRILDLTQGVAGPYCTKLFADYGADVIKIERPDGGDPARRVGPFPADEPHHDRSGLFLELNTSKRSVTLNLKTATGQRMLRRLAGNADLVIESFRPGTLARLGLDATRLQELNGQTALVSISNFGQTPGPYRDYELDDFLAYAMGGVLDVTAYEGREPVKIGIYAPLFLVGAVAASFAFGALWGAQRSGRGERVDIAVMDVLAASMDRGGTNLVSAAYSGGLGHDRAGPRSSAMPSGVYPCADGYVQVNILSAWWPRLCNLLGRPELATDPAYTEHIYDPDFGPEIDKLWYPWVLARTKQEVMEQGQASGIGAAALNTVDDVMRDAHLRARDFWVTLDHRGVGPLEFPGLPFRMLGTPGDIRPAPRLGEHTLEVLTQRLGYSRRELVQLRQRNVV